MKRQSFFTAVAAIGLLAALPAWAAQSHFDVAITVDDLPAHGTLPPGTTRLQVARAFVAALTAHHVPEAYGFVNGVHVTEDPANLEALTVWRAAGYPLGNHTYTHMNANAGTVEAFEGDIENGEPVLETVMKGGNWHYLRFPFLSSGDDPARHAEIMAYLKAHGYRIAEVSMNYNDWAYTDPYARCMAKGDATAVEALKVRYMAGMKEAVAHARRLSKKVYGRYIPFVLMLHEGAFTALMLPRVLTEFEAEGARFVTLEQAESDPAYDENDPHAGQGLVTERTAAAKGIDGAPWPRSIDDLDSVCR